MITLDQYFGCWLKCRDVTEQVIDNAEKLLDAVSKLMALADYDNVPLPINPDTDSQVSGREYGGFRPRECIGLIGSRKSAHLQGLAVDIYDPTNALDEWITDGVLETCGLYREHPSATHGWCHLTTRAPGSGKRTFYP